jgi:hypothetical protein
VSATVAPFDVIFDPTPEIFATDNTGAFFFPLLVDGKQQLATRSFDEVRFVFSLWHPSGQRTIDLDKAYLELRGAFDPEEDHWARIAEIELPIMASHSGYALAGAGFEPRARLQIRATAYFVA